MNTELTVVKPTVLGVLNERLDLLISENCIIVSFFRHVFSY
jgi:hypothetical protein